MELVVVRDGSAGGRTEGVRALPVRKNLTWRTGCGGRISSIECSHGWDREF